MTHRSAAAALALACCFSIPAVALADVAPPADGGVDEDCSIESQSESGETCQQCLLQGSSSSACQDELGPTYQYVCSYSSSIQVWCNGPNRLAAQDPTCAMRAAPPSSRGGALAALVGVAAVAAMAVRRRRGHP